MAELCLSCESSDYDPSASDTNDSASIEGPDDFVRPYQFEPYADESTDPADTDSTVLASSDREDRLNSSSWCQCGNCSSMGTLKECLCCAEVEEMAAVLAEIPGCKCITQHPGFQTVCLDVYVLRTAYSQYRQQYRKNIQNENNCYRYTAYRQLTRFVWGLLGKDIRVVLPSCAVVKIRDTFPSADGRYTGYLEPE